MKIDNPMSVLTYRQVIMIEELNKLRLNCCEIARVTGLNRRNINDIILKNTWKK